MGECVFDLLCKLGIAQKTGAVAGVERVFFFIGE